MTSTRAATTKTPAKTTTKTPTKTPIKTAAKTSAARAGTATARRTGAAAAAPTAVKTTPRTHTRTRPADAPPAERRTTVPAARTAAVDGPRDDVRHLGYAVLDLAGQFTCSEAEAICRLLVWADETRTAVKFLTLHANGDEDGDTHDHLIAVGTALERILGRALTADELGDAIRLHEPF